MATSPTLMSEDAAREFHSVVMLHLQTYAELHKLSGEAAPNRCLWQLAPKHHHLQHCAYDVLQQRVNPRSYTLPCGESWIGLMGKVSRMCHRSSVSFRVAQRHMCILAFELAKCPAE